MRIHKNAVTEGLLAVADAFQLFLLLIDKVLFVPILHLVHIVIDICPKHIEDGTTCNIVFSTIAKRIELPAYLIKADCKVIIAKGERCVTLFYMNFRRIGVLPIGRGKSRFLLESFHSETGLGTAVAFFSQNKLLSGKLFSLFGKNTFFSI